MTVDPDRGPTAEALRRVRSAGILTVLGLNLVPSALLTGWAIMIMNERSAREYDWSGVVATIVVLFGGSAIALAAVMGMAIAAIGVTRRLRAGGEATPAAGIRWGAISFLLGWAGPAAALSIHQLLQRF